MCDRVIVATEPHGRVVDILGLINGALMPSAITVDKDKAIPVIEVNVHLRPSREELIHPRVDVWVCISHVRICGAEVRVRPVVAIVNDTLRVVSLAPTATIEEYDGLVSAIPVALRVVDPSW